MTYDATSVFSLLTAVIKTLIKGLFEQLFSFPFLDKYCQFQKRGSVPRNDARYQKRLEKTRGNANKLNKK